MTRCGPSHHVHMGLIGAVLGTSLTGDKRGAAFTAASPAAQSEVRKHKSCDGRLLGQRPACSPAQGELRLAGSTLQGCTPGAGQGTCWLRAAAAEDPGELWVPGAPAPCHYPCLRCAGAAAATPAPVSALVLALLLAGGPSRPCRVPAPLRVRTHWCSLSCAVLQLHRGLCRSEEALGRVMDTHGGLGQSLEVLGAVGQGSTTSGVGRARGPGGARPAWRHWALPGPSRN